MSQLKFAYFLRLKFSWIHFSLDKARSKAQNKYKIYILVIEFVTFYFEVFLPIKYV